MCEDGCGRLVTESALVSVVDWLLVSIMRSRRGETVGRR